MYRELRNDRIIATLEALGRRIQERFPDANLSHVSRELLDFAHATNARVERLRQPYRWLRASVVTLLVAAIVLAVAAFRSSGLSLRFEHVGDFFQGLDAAVNEIILFAVAIVSLWTVEGRLKRRVALRALHELRCLAHVIDMHQLTKDPDVVLAAAAPTPSSPQRTLTRLELSRYLSYCSELLSLVGKLAALHVQYLPDPVVLEATNDVEALADGLARKIWQKLTMLDSNAGAAPGASAS